MLPLHQAYELRDSVLEYIKATYHFRDAAVSNAFYDFISDDERGLYRGPFVTLKTPFVKGNDEGAKPLEIMPQGYTPHKHQMEAFKRLSCRDGHQPLPTLLTTGTGSGKTECFLYPILDYVYSIQQKNPKKGIKVIIMYPMNALATDQAARLAEYIHNDERLNGKVTAGLFLGLGRSADQKFSTVIREDRIIEDRKTIVANAPDILLTNFKMLDFALIKKEFQPLWEGNLNEPNPMLKFVVLDELHTYDGAQGTDVANLLRRLKLKLGMKQGDLVPVGTSATIGGSGEARGELCRYASYIFGEPFDESSIIGEERLSKEQFFAEKLDPFLPPLEELQELSIHADDSAADYIDRIKAIWLRSSDLAPQKIGSRLRELQIMSDLYAIIEGNVPTVPKIINSMINNPLLTKHYDERWNGLTMKDKRTFVENIVVSLLSLVSIAKNPENARIPLLYLQVMLWQRELSGIRRAVDDEPRFVWEGEHDVEHSAMLPIFYCRSCGASGWLTRKTMTDRRLSADKGAIFSAFYSRNTDLKYMLPKADVEETMIEEYVNSREDAKLECTIDKSTLHMVEASDMTSGDMDVLVLGRNKKSGTEGDTFDLCCPYCMENDISIVGSRLSTLSSVAVSQLLASEFSAKDSNKRKLLIFTNSVQDAAYLAGYFEVRSYRFILRQSIQEYLNSVGHAMSLSDLQKGFKAYWKAKLTPKAGEEKNKDEYYYRFLFDNRVDIEDYRNKKKELSERFRSEFDQRVDWEIAAQFGLLSQIGRTLEKSGACATFFSDKVVREVSDSMEKWLVRQPGLKDFIGKKDAMAHFINGILHRMRIRGGIDHYFLEQFRNVSMTQIALNWGLKSNKNKPLFYQKFGGNSGITLAGY